jgi:hypothetical protein
VLTYQMNNVYNFDNLLIAKLPEVVRANSGGALDPHTVAARMNFGLQPGALRPGRMQKIASSSTRRMAYRSRGARLLQLAQDHRQRCGGAGQAARRRAAPAAPNPNPNPTLP